MAVDFECTLWPDVWFGASITPCCIDHDLGGSDLELAQCVLQQFSGPGVVFGFLLALVMYVGLKLFKRLYLRITKAVKGEDK